jgi:methionyl-tRNA formyltransferase
MTDTRILFMGTPEFASTCLEYLIKNGYNIVGVVCQPDSPRDRGHKIAPPPVKQCLKDLSVPVCQPETLKNCALLPFLEQTKPDLIAVVAYGRILPMYVLEYPKYGCINLHGSVLPKYRGAAPIARAIMNGEEKTGLSTMYLAQGMDEGDIIFTLETQIGGRETAGDLTARLAALGAPLLAKTIDAVAAGTAPRTPQDHERATYAPPIQKHETRLDFSMSAKRVYNTFRALTPNPGTTTLCRGRILKITDMDYYDESIPGGAAGEVVYASKKALAVRCGDGNAVCILRLAPEGKREMGYADFINGRGVSEGEILGF